MTARSAKTLCAVAFLLASWRAEAAEPVALQPSARLTSASNQASDQRLSLDEMGAISGGTEVKVDALARQQLTATTTGNSITAGTLSSGSVSFSPEALNGFNGVGNFVINTGMNSSLQGAINLNIVTAPTP